MYSSSWQGWRLVVNQSHHNHNRRSMLGRLRDPAACDFALLYNTVGRLGYRHVDPPSSTGWTSWNPEASAQSLNLAAGETSASWTESYFPSDVQQTSLPYHSLGVHSEPRSSTGNAAWPAAVSCVGPCLASCGSCNGIAATRTSSSLVGLYTGDSHTFRPPLVMAILLLYMGLLLREFRERAFFGPSRGSTVPQCSLAANVNFHGHHTWV